MANINDVAKFAGVGKATVSRYLNNKQVSKDNEIKIKDAIDKLNYKPSMIARGLSNKEINLIGIIVPDLLNPFFTEIVSIIEKHAAMKKYNCLIFSSQNNIEYENDAINMCELFNVKAIILATTENNKDISNINTKLVAIDRHIENAINIGIDNIYAGSLIANFFIEKKAKNILYVDGDKNIDTSQKRRESFSKVMENKNIKYDYVSSNYSDVMKVYDDIKQICNIEKYDAIFMGNEIIAFAIVKYLKKMNIKKDFIGLTFDKTYLNDFMFENIKTIKQPISMIAKKAIKEAISKESDIKEIICEIEVE